MPSGVRTMMLSSYDIPKAFYAGMTKWSAAKRVGTLGCMLYYAVEIGHNGRKRRVKVNVDELTQRWKKMVVGLATAHTKDEADKMEANVEECLQPVLTMPIAQVRELAGKLADALELDPSVPYLVHRAYRVWIDQMKRAPDEEVKALKKQLAREIVDLVSEDAKAQLPDAMVRALMWRAPETLEEVKAVVQTEKAAGRSVRLKGRESCLFLEAGGTEDDPKVCVQV